MFPRMFAFNSGMVSVTDKSFYLLKKKLKVKKYIYHCFPTRRQFPCEQKQGSFCSTHDLLPAFRTVSSTKNMVHKYLMTKRLKGEV